MALVQAINIGDFWERLLSGNATVKNIIEVIAFFIVTLAGSVIRGGVFTSNSLLSADFRDDAGTLCIQYVESIVLDSCLIVYENSFLYGIPNTDNLSGPFRYSDSL